jgi:phage-related protein
VYTFIVKQGMLRFEDYVQRDLDAQQTGSGNINEQFFEWDAVNGGLVLGVEPMAIETYQAAPIQRQRLKQNEAGRINKVQISLGDVKFQNSQLFLANASLIKGAKIIVRRTSLDLEVTQPSAYRTIFRGYVSGMSAKEGNIQLEVAERYHDWSRPLNKRTFAKICSFVFKDSRCGYSGPETFCDKTLPACQAYGNEASFGGFPELPSLQFKMF